MVQSSGVLERKVMGSVTMPGTQCGSLDSTQHIVTFYSLITTKKYIM